MIKIFLSGNTSRHALLDLMAINLDTSRFALKCMSTNTTNVFKTGNFLSSYLHKWSVTNSFNILGMNWWMADFISQITYWLGLWPWIQFGTSNTNHLQSLAPWSQPTSQIPYCHPQRLKALLLLLLHVKALQLSTNTKVNRPFENHSLFIWRQPEAPVPTDPPLYEI